MTQQFNTLRIFDTVRILQMSSPAVLTKELVDEVLSTRCLDKLYDAMKQYREEREHNMLFVRFDEIEDKLYTLLEFREKRKSLNKAIMAVRKNRFAMGDDPKINIWVKLSRGRHIYDAKPHVLDSFQKSDYAFYVQEYQPAMSDATLDAEILNLVRTAKCTRWYTLQNGEPTTERIRLEEKRLHACIHNIVAKSKHLTENFAVLCIKEEMSFMGFKDIDVYRKYSNGIYSVVGTFNGKRYVTVA